MWTWRIVSLSCHLHPVKCQGWGFPFSIPSCLLSRLYGKFFVSLCCFMLVYKYFYHLYIGKLLTELAFHIFIKKRLKDQKLPSVGGLLHLVRLKPGSYFLRMQMGYECWRHNFAMKLALSCVEGNSLANIDCERRIVTSNLIRIRRKYEPGLRV